MRRAAAVMATLALGGVVLGACATSGGTTTTTTVGVTKDLVATPAVRRTLFVALAKYHQLPTMDYVGLAPKMTYYAFDGADSTFYAAAGLVPSPHSLKAQVGTQDDGGYNLLTRKSASTTWKVYDDGLGAAQDSICPIKIPPSVLAAWGWKPRSCFPPIAP